jgi:hypothetical protein
MGKRGGVERDEGDRGEQEKRGRDASRGEPNTIAQSKFSAT